ncbi:MAG TPA: hypothetical protein VK335_22435 [Bryobacteraceae bacterium]|nr:hypothetical protein [Bryobacteraceae bacterium]
MPNSTVEIQFRLHATGRPPGRTGPPDAPASRNGHLPRVTQVLALAIQFQDMIQRGEARDYADLARLGCVTRERMSQIMELVWLAPEIQREILEFPPTGGARFPISEVAVRRLVSDLSWEEQQRRWHELKQIHHLL